MLGLRAFAAVCRFGLSGLHGDAENHAVNPAET